MAVEKHWEAAALSQQFLSYSEENCSQEVEKNFMRKFSETKQKFTET